MIVKRRPGIQPGMLTPEQAQKTKAFNEDMRYCQGFRIQVASGSSSQNLSLNSPGKFLLGISATPGNTDDISDTQVTFVVNNNNLLLNFPCSNLNPNFVGNMIFFPLPQPLQGNDTLTASFTNNDGGAVIMYLNVFYLPR